MTTRTTKLTYPDEAVIESVTPGYGPAVKNGNTAGTRLRVQLVPLVPPVDPPPGQPAFGARPHSEPIVINGGTDVEVSGKTFADGVIAVTLRNVNRAYIHDCDWLDVVGGVYVSQCTDVRVEDCRGRNVGDGTIGAGHSNHIQFAETTGGAIRRNRFLGGRTEDMCSLWHSGGHGLGAELIVEDNHLQGLVTDIPTARAYTSSSGTGIIISDGAGSPRNGWVIVRRNTLLTPGQVGIQHIDGPGIQTYDNVIYGQFHPKSNNPMTSWEGNPRGEVRNNRYLWTGADGKLKSPWFGGGGSLVVHDNVQDATLDPATLRVVL